MKQYVDMKDKQSENRMLKAISESEGRLTQLIMKAFSAPKQAASNMPSDICGHVGSSKNVVDSCGEEISGPKKGSGKEILSSVNHIVAFGSTSVDAYGALHLDHVLDSVLPEINVAAVKLPEPTLRRPVVSKLFPMLYFSL